MSRKKPKPVDEIQEQIYTIAKALRHARSRPVGELDNHLFDATNALAALNYMWRTRTRSIVGNLENEVERYRTRNTELQEALRKYGYHLPTCPMTRAIEYVGADPLEFVCSCGFTAALSNSANAQERREG